MIIRMTVDDNDFQQELENFAGNLLIRLSKVWQEAVMANDCSKENFLELLSPVAYPRLDNRQKKLVCEAVQRAWGMYVEREFETHSIDEETRNYLNDSFKVSISYVFHDKWENGEAAYYFTSQRICLIQ